VTVTQLREVVEMLPGWDEVAGGLRTLILGSGYGDVLGWYSASYVALCEWERGLWWDDTLPRWVEQHADILDALDVEQEPNGADVVLRWTEDQARAFMLLAVLPHELGHHHDRMTTRSKRFVARGEAFAEEYERRVFFEVWPKYARRYWL
jgi:hypothetical protein